MERRRVLKKGDVHFYKIQTNFRLLNKQFVKAWLLSVVKMGKKTVDKLSFIFCTDEYLLALNKKYLNHHTLTDIITFDYSDKITGKSAFISGDIFISIDRVKENALEYGTGFDKELYRVMVHGVLHLLGYRDKGKKEKETMRKLENLYLGMLPESLLNPRRMRRKKPTLKNSPKKRNQKIK